MSAIKVPLMRSFIFGYTSFNPKFAYSIPRRTHKCAAIIPEFAWSLPKQTGKLGSAVSTTDPIILAEDIPGMPPMRAHTNYSGKYYPRRMCDYLTDLASSCSLRSAYDVTGNLVFRSRMIDVASFNLYAQYGADGTSRFGQAHFGAPPSNQNWKFGFDYLFDWVWTDSFSYKWQLHEPDHHVNSLNASGLLKTYERLKKSHPDLAASYLVAATEYIQHQIPRYGFHTGIWTDSRGIDRRFFWTEYSPTGKIDGIENEGRDAVDNVQALVAMAAAQAGYHANRPDFLNLAKGLLWYLVREFRADGRFYYYGAESPLESLRKAESHDNAVIEPALQALGYLILAGVAETDLISEFEDVLHTYRHDDTLRGILGWDVRYAKVWRAATLVPSAGLPNEISEYVLLTSSEIRDLRFFSPLSKGSTVTISKWNPDESAEQWIKLGTWTNSIGNALMSEILPDFRASMGDLYRLNYSWSAYDPVKFDPVCPTALDGGACNKYRFYIEVITQQNMPDGTPMKLTRYQEAITSDYGKQTVGEEVYDFSKIPLTLNAENWLAIAQKFYLP